MTYQLSRSRRYGFTLVEMLVVITIIAILAGLVLVGAGAARTFVRRGAILTEMDNLSGSLQEYEKKYGSYPPNTVQASTIPVSDPTVLYADLKRHFKQAFSKHQEPDDVFKALAGIAPASGVMVQGGMNGAEALCFYLGGFSDDQRYPISGPGGPSFASGDVEDLEGRSANAIHSFELSRLGPRAANGQFDATKGRFVRYRVLVNGQPQVRQINLWTYASANSTQPYIYFDTSRYKPMQYDPQTLGVVALKTLPSGGGTQIQFANPKSFQILHAGLDNNWGDFSKLSSRMIAKDQGIVYPNGPFTEDLADNLANFSRTTLEDSEP
jgi:prepilin-type N-terminal cleavage/methylation domain-containing protein